MEIQLPTVTSLSSAGNNQIVKIWIYCGILTQASSNYNTWSNSAEVIGYHLVKAKNIAHSFLIMHRHITAALRNCLVFGKLKLLFHEETLSWQKESSSLSSATSQSGHTLAESL